MNLHMPNLPEFQSIRRIRGALVAAINPVYGGTAIRLSLVLGDLVDGVAPTDFIDVTPVWNAFHQPKVGGYFIDYGGGLQSFWPAERFEQEYVQIPASAPREPTAEQIEDGQFYDGAQWDGDTLARLSNLMKPQASIVTDFNRIASSCAYSALESTPALRTVEALTTPQRTFPTDHKGEIDQ